MNQPPTLRSFVSLLLLFAIAGTGVSVSGDEKMGPSLQGLDARLSVPERIRLIEQFVHHRYYDKTGLMYSHMNWKEERPFTPADFTPVDSSAPGPEAYQWMSYENSAHISGIFLTAQCYRYEVTKDPEALAFARQAYGSIDANYRLTEQRDPASQGLEQKDGIIDLSAQDKGAQNGFFCKPYYGLVTDHTSTEQHFWPLVGLFRYWPLAPPDVQQRITKIFGEVSRRWRAGYKINYFGETWDMEQSYPRAQRHMFLWAVIHRMAFELTRDRASYDEFARLDALYGAMPTPRETIRGLGRLNYISTEDRSFHVQMVMGAEILARLEPASAARYRHGALEWWKYSFIGQREDLASYYFIKVDALTGEWTKLPLAIKPRAVWRSPFMLNNATLPICWLGTRERQALTSAIIARWVPEEGGPARERLGKIYHELGKDQLKWFVDPEGIMPRELTWMLNVLQGDALAFYPLGFWYARANGIEL